MKKILLFLLVIIVIIVFPSCEGPVGPQGIPGVDGVDASDGEDGVSSLNLVRNKQNSAQKIKFPDQPKKMTHAPFIFFRIAFRFMPREGDSYFIVGLISSLFFSTFIIWGILAVYSFNLAENANTTAESHRGNAPANVTDLNKETYLSTDDDVFSSSLVIDLGSSQTMNFILLQEYIKLGQRVKQFSVEVWQESAWKPVAKATTIGYKRILKLDNPEITNKIRINI
jgi:hypothetical protein